MNTKSEVKKKKTKLLKWKSVKQNWPQLNTVDNTKLSDRIESKNFVVVQKNVIHITKKKQTFELCGQNDLVIKKQQQKKSESTHTYSEGKKSASLTLS